MTELQLLEKLSKKFRKQLEDFRKVDKKWKANLRGGCAIGSVLLFKELKKRNIECWMVHASHKSIDHGDHVWVETPNYMIDITAGQFKDLPPILILDRKSDEYDNYQGHFFNELSIGMSFFELVRWPKAQDPKDCLIRMTKIKQKTKKKLVLCN